MFQEPIYYYFLLLYLFLVFCYVGDKIQVALNIEEVAYTHNTSTT